MQKISFILLALIFTTCSTRHVNEPIVKKSEIKSSQKKQYDFDKDNINDSIFVAYSGGTHCCYALTFWLSKSNKKVEIPYALEGGYVYGFPIDESISDKDNNGFPEMVVRCEIERYMDENGE